MCFRATTFTEKSTIYNLTFQSTNELCITYKRVGSNSNPNYTLRISTATVLNTTMYRCRGHWNTKPRTGYRYDIRSRKFAGSCNRTRRVPMFTFIKSNIQLYCSDNEVMRCCTGERVWITINASYCCQISCFVGSDTTTNHRAWIFGQSQTNNLQGRSNIVVH